MFRVWNSTASDGEAAVLKLLGVCSTFSLLLGSLWSEVVVPNRVLSVDQIDLFENSYY